MNACGVNGNYFAIHTIAFGKSIKTALRWEAACGFNENARKLAQAAAMKHTAARQQRTSRPSSARKKEPDDCGKQHHRSQDPSVYFSRRTNPASSSPPLASGAIGLTLTGLRNKYNRLPMFGTSWPEFLMHEHKILLGRGCEVSAAAVFQVGRQVCCEDGPRVVCYDSDDEEMEELEQELEQKQQQLEQPQPQQQKDQQKEKRRRRASKASLPRPESQAEPPVTRRRQTKRKTTHMAAPPLEHGAKRTPREYFLAQPGVGRLSVSLRRERPVRNNAQMWWNLSKRSGRPCITWLEILQELHETAESTDEAEVLQHLACRALNGNDSESVPEEP